MIGAQMCISAGVPELPSERSRGCGLKSHSLLPLGTQKPENAAGKMFIFTKDVTCITNWTQKMHFPVEKAFL